MPYPGKRWRHIGISTQGSWFPGDARGFRNHEHRIHSSGDYHTPPPLHEHAGLRKYVLQRACQCVKIRWRLRERIGQAIVDNLVERGHRVLCVAVSVVHAHLLIELPDDVGTIKTAIGWAKQKSSVAVTNEMPGQIWGEGLAYDPVDDVEHHRNTYDYILTKQGRWAWTWSYKEGRYWKGASSEP